ncbi:MAG: pantoate--beta-alanine ligase [Blastocatellia bacterium AA13]|nr:MAG: pantoate--beta-alanine ligase [Blastocatellia bacterium AA13]
MEIINRIPRMMSVARELKARGKRIGLVPTMGAFHEGHLSLMSRAREMSDTVITSVFVNPMQFGPGEDYERYPRDLARDAELAFTRGVDLIFAPPASEVYPEGFTTYVNVEGLTDRLEGASRPGHFRGVTTVVNKLFNIVQPQFAFFGRKDAQQVIVIKRMVHDLAMGIEIVVGPTVREEDGLALSSRNAYLSSEDRKAAIVLRRALERGRALYNSGERDAGRLVSAIQSLIESEPRTRVDYVSVNEVNDLREPALIRSDRATLISAAIYIGDTRLIDNIVLNGEL